MPDSMSHLELSLWRLWIVLKRIAEASSGDWAASVYETVRPENAAGDSAAVLGWLAVRQRLEAEEHAAADALERELSGLLVSLDTDDRKEIFARLLSHDRLELREFGRFLLRCATRQPFYHTG
jgi:hypothetical protein